MSTLRLLAWNVRTGNKEATAAVRDLIDEHKPHVVALSEAYSFHLPDGFCGYDVLQEETPKGWFKEPVSEHGELAALIRPGVIVKRDRVVPMTRRWVGPVNGLLHDPRRHRRLRVVVEGQVWRVSLEHWPTGGIRGRNGAAVTEVRDRALSWLRRGVRAPSIVVGDLNVGTFDLKQMVSRHTVAGHGPDNVIVRKATVTRTVLDKYGSDHAAVLYVLSR